ncbi:iron-sulfur cluster assembly scaffold protein [Chloroflexota bacterium]
MYSEKVMDHFTNPRNVGEIEDPDGVGEEGNPVYGSMIIFYIKVDYNRLRDVKFKTFGCEAAIAVSSIVSEMAKGKTLEKARKITPALVLKELQGLPKNKHHCSNLGVQALNKAIDDYLDKQEKKVHLRNKEET